MNESSTFEILPNEGGDREGSVRFRLNGRTYIFGCCGYVCTLCTSYSEMFNREVSARFSGYQYSDGVTEFFFDGRGYLFLDNCDDCTLCEPDRELFYKLTAGGFQPSTSIEVADDVTSSPADEPVCDNYPDCGCYDRCEGVGRDTLAQQLQEALQQNAEMQEQLAIFELLKSLSVIALESAKAAIEEHEETETQLRGMLTELSDEISNLKYRLERAEADVKFWNEEYNLASQRESTAFREQRVTQSQLRDLQELHTNLLYAAVTGERQRNEVPF